MSPPASRSRPPGAEGDEFAHLDPVQERAFGYFLRTANPENGLVADSSRPDSPSSIAAVGFGLAAYPIGVERGWIARADAVARTLTVLHFFSTSDQSGEALATGYRGLYFHFLDRASGKRAWDSELSGIDTALLVAGMLTAATYFDQNEPAEVELRELALALYHRVDWGWTEQDDHTVAQGWKPECGFLHYGWQGYSESLILYVLGLASPTHPLSAASFTAWTATYQWENLYGFDLLLAGPLFIHLFSHMWIDFRGIRDEFMREKNSDYFENSRRMVMVQREYAIRNPGGFLGYGADSWGLSAGEGPHSDTRLVDGRIQGFYGYAARGVPYGPDDGTIAGGTTLASLVFAPETVMPVVEKMLARNEDGKAVLASGFNDTAIAPLSWISDGELGLDQGMLVLMIENFRSELLWRLGRKSSWVRLGLERAGFKGGWLKEAS